MAQEPKEVEVSNDDNTEEVDSKENITPSGNPEVPKGSRKRPKETLEEGYVPCRKNTRSSGPTTWDCPLCENKKYKSEDKYYKHLLEVHRITKAGTKLPKNKPTPSKGKKK